MSVDIDVVRQEIGDEEIGVYILSIAGTVDEDTLSSSFTFALRRKDRPAGEHRLTATYDLDRRNYALKIGGLTGVDDIILCALQKLALHGAVHAAGCMRKAINSARPRGDRRQIAILFAQCMGQNAASFIARAITALIECARGAPGTGNAADP